MIQNNLLAALSETGHLDLISYLTKVSVSLGEVLHQAREEIQYVYFPEYCVISILSTMEDGSTVEVGVVGHEGMLGLHALPITIARAAGGLSAGRYKLRIG